MTAHLPVSLRRSLIPARAMASVLNGEGYRWLMDGSRERRVEGSNWEDEGVVWFCMAALPNFAAG